MNIANLWRWGTEVLSGSGVENPRFTAELLLREVLGVDRAYYLTHTDEMVTDEQVERYREYIRQRSLGTPLQYIIGRQEFYGRDFLVTPAVLIPRPETELLVEAVLEWLGGTRAPSSWLLAPGRTEERCDSEMPKDQTFCCVSPLIFLDLCTGSGCIGLTLAAEVEEARVVLSDISEDALAVAKENSSSLGLEKRIELRRGDLFSAVSGRKFSCIMSNPPYIERAEISGLSREVQQEPSGALDGGEDGLDFYRRIVQEAPQYLLPGGMLALEIGDGQGRAVMEMLGQAGFSAVRLSKDLAQKERVVTGVFLLDKTPR